MRNLLALLLLASLPLAAHAQISTDRPGLTYSPSLLEKGMMQFELGIPEVATSSHNLFGTRYSATGYSVPLLARYGASRRVELRAGTSLYNGARVKVGSFSESKSEVGFDVIMVGAKFGLLDGTDGRPTLSLTPELGIATEGGKTAVSLVGAMGFPLSGSLALNLTGGLMGPTEEFSDNLQGLLAGALGGSLSGALRGYGELALMTSRIGNAVTLGGGLKYLVTPNVQLDAALRAGLTDAAPDLTYGLGVGFRF